MITITADDGNGNISKSTFTITVTDKTPPEAPLVNMVNSEDFAVTGTGTPGDTIMVTFPDGTTATGIVQPDGTWTVNIPSGVDLTGCETLPVTATDKAGNISIPTYVTVEDVLVPPVDTDGDGVFDTIDSDDDNDGVNDSVEVVSGLDPKNSDTDKDGFNNEGETVSHNSSTSKQKNEQKLASKNTQTSQKMLPDTGEANSNGAAALMAAIGGFALLVARRRRQEDVQTEEK